MINDTHFAAAGNEMDDLRQKSIDLARQSKRLPWKERVEAAGEFLSLDTLYRFGNASKRRQKKMLGRLQCFEEETGKLVPTTLRHLPNVQYFPVFHTFYEEVSSPLVALMGRWLGHHLAEGRRKSGREIAVSMPIGDA